MAISHVVARVSCDDGDLAMAMVGNGVGWQWRWLAMAMVGNGVGWQWRWLAMAMVGNGNGRPVAKSGDWEKYI